MFVDFGDVVIDSEHIIYLSYSVDSDGRKKTFVKLDAQDQQGHMMFINLSCPYDKARALLCKTNQQTRINHE